jgi:hypothetical protein
MTWLILEGNRIPKWGPGRTHRVWFGSCQIVEQFAPPNGRFIALLRYNGRGSLEPLMAILSNSVRTVWLSREESTTRRIYRSLCGSTTQKRCGRCFEEKPFADFAKARDSRDGHRHYCRDCDRVTSTERRRKKRELG